MNAKTKAVTVGRMVTWSTRTTPVAPAKIKNKGTKTKLRETITWVVVSSVNQPPDNHGKVIVAHLTVIT